MKLSDFLDRVKGLPPETVLCVSEVDEAFGATVAEVEIVEDARAARNDAAETEAVELANGSDRVVVIRW